MNEMQALMGDLMLPDLPEIIVKRKALTQTYLEGLVDISGIDTHSIENSLKTKEYNANFSYLPICFDLAIDDVYKICEIIKGWS